MPAPASLDKLPRPVVYGLYGTLAGLLAALTVGELVWYLLRPAPPEAEAYTAPPSPKPAAPKLAITVSPKVQVYPGGSNLATIRVARERPDDSITIMFAPAAGVSGSQFTIPTGETAGQGEITAAADAKPGVYKLALTATAADGPSQTASVEVAVLPLPPPLPRLAVSLSPKVQAYQRGKNTFAVKVVRGEFTGDVTVSFDSLPAGATIPEVTIPAGESEATAGLTAEGTTKTGLHTFRATARTPQVGAAPAATETQLEVIGSPKLPVDVVLVLDCTGSMRKAHAGLEASLAKFGTELGKAQLEPRFALVGFQDRTLGQMLQVPQFNDEPTTTDIGQLRTAISGLRLGGGGGEGDSSLDGIARAAESPGRQGVPRIVLLVTDGAPKKVDWRIKSMEEMVKLLKEKKIDQLHVATTPDHKKAFEPLWEGARGKYLDLAAANMSGDYDKLMTDLGKLVWESLPERPENKPAPSGMAAVPVLPPVGTVKPPGVPPGAEPDEPKIEKPATLSAPVAEAVEPPSKSRRIFAMSAWILVVAGLVCGAMIVGQMKFLPGEPPTLGAGAVSYGVGLFAGLAAGAVGQGAFNAVDLPFLARLTGGCGIGLGFGLLVPLAQLLRQDGEQKRKALKLDPPEQPLELDGEPQSSAPAAKPAPTAVKPVIAAPKPRDGCPGCGRVIPGEPGKRYCMLCDKTF